MNVIVESCYGYLKGLSLTCGAQLLCTPSQQCVAQFHHLQYVVA